MDKYDLAHVGGEHTFMYKPDGMQASYPIHMELNDWAKNELALFCESIIEEYEEELTGLLMEELDEGGLRANLTQRVCKEQLNLCVPPKPTKKKKDKNTMPKTREGRLKRARKVFKSLDTDGDGWITRQEYLERIEGLAQAGEGSGKPPEEEVDKFFDGTDKDSNGKINFYEYKFLWVSAKNAASAEEEESGEKGLDYYVGPTLAALWEQWAPMLASWHEEAPIALFGGLGVTTAALCAGAVALRRS